MGTLTLTELQDELRDNLGGRTDLGNTRLTRFLDQAQVKIARRANWNELRVLEEVTLTYSGTAKTDRFFAFSSLTNSNPRLIHAIVMRAGTSSWKIRKSLARVSDTVFPARDLYSTGKPRWYMEWEDKIEWSPVPDKSYVIELRITNWPTPLTGTNKSDLDEKDDLLLLDASRRAMRSLGMHESALSMAKDYEFEMLDAINDNATKPDIFATPSNTVNALTGATAKYWADPFTRRAP